MISHRTLELLARLAARDVASAEQKAADAQAKVQALEREAAMLGDYMEKLQGSLRERVCQGYDFKVTTGFLAASLRAQSTAEDARQRGEQARQAAFDRLATEMQRRDALDAAQAAAAAELALSQERAAERVASPRVAPVAKPG
jgi:flagellar biosynthesis chaperone FliJ